VRQAKLALFKVWQPYYLDNEKALLKTVGEDVRLYECCNLMGESLLVKLIFAELYQEPGTMVQQDRVLARNYASPIAR